MAAAQPGGSSVAAWGLGTCSDFTATNDLNKDSQSSEHQEAKEWTKLTEKTDGGAVQCPRTTRELQGTSPLRQCDVAAQPSTLPGSNPRETSRPRSP